MKTIADRVAQIGSELGEPASPEIILEVEHRLGVELPLELKEFLLIYNGATAGSEGCWWKFWSCSEIATYAQHCETEEFFADANDLRKIDPSVYGPKFDGNRLILFADVFISLPIYGIYIDPGHQFDGFVFDISTGSLSARTFPKWAQMFVEHADDGLLYE